MQATDTDAQTGTRGLRTMVRNRYYYGKLLDVVHFDLEQEYHYHKRQLINRLVLGCGVVCGLDVELTRDGGAVLVTAGAALDGLGREIVVPGPSRPIELPPPPDTKDEKSSCDDDYWHHLVICYHECNSSPEPGPGDECGVESCVSSLVQERYRLEWRSGKAPEAANDPSIADLISGDRINRRAVAMRVTRACTDCGCGGCIVLANVRVAGDESEAVDIDISVRPVVYTNDLLYDLITAVTGERRNGARGK